MGTPNANSQPEAIKDVVKEKYSAIARGETRHCCGTADVSEEKLYNLASKSLGYDSHQIR